MLSDSMKHGINQWKSENVDVPLMHEKRTGHVSMMTKEEGMRK